MENMNLWMQMSRVAEFYSERSVLITGVTGFLGTVLLEKLLRSCQKISAIYLLIRPKNGMSASTRLHHLLTQNKIFTELEKTLPNFKNKLIPISGDVTKPDLGLEQKDFIQIARSTSVIFHLAGTSKSEADFKSCVLLNVCGLQYILDLSHSLTNFTALIHVSSAYTRDDIPELDEKVYKNGISQNDVMEICNWMDDEMIEKIYPRIISGYANACSFSKAMAEQILSENKDIRSAIIRPAMITAAWKEPIPGWTKNSSYLSSFLILAAKGLVHTVDCKTSDVMDFIPVDICVNLLITAGYQLAHAPSWPVVYNCTTACSNPCTWNQFLRLASERMHAYPMNKLYWYPFFATFRNRWLNSITWFMYQFLPSLSADLYLLFRWKKRGVISIQHRANAITSHLKLHTGQQWSFISDNAIRLCKTASPIDNKVFYTDVQEIEWEKYVANYFTGIQQNLPHDERPSHQPPSRKRLRWLYALHLGIHFGSALLIWNTLCPYNITEVGTSFLREASAYFHHVTNW